MERINDKEEFLSVRAEMDALIKEATEKGLLSSDADNEYTKKIGELAKRISDYEINVLKLLPIRAKNPLIASIEDYLYSHNMKNKDGAVALGVSESVFSQIMSEKKRITMPIAKKIKSKFCIDANLILDYA